MLKKEANIKISKDLTIHKISGFEGFNREDIGTQFIVASLDKWLLEAGCTLWIAFEKEDASYSAEVLLAHDFESGLYSTDVPDEIMSVEGEWLYQIKKKWNHDQSTGKADRVMASPDADTFIIKYGIKDENGEAVTEADLSNLYSTVVSAAGSVGGTAQEAENAAVRAENAAQRAEAALTFEVDDSEVNQVGKASVTITETGNLKFSNLKGEKGDTGATGPQGPIGPQGDTGPAGAPMLPRRFYPSVDAMNADIDNVSLNDLAIIQSPEGAADEDNAKMYMAVVIDELKQWVFVSDLSGAKGADGTISAAGMCPVAVTEAMWTGSTRPYSLTITYSETSAPGTQNIGRTRFLMVGFLPNESENSASGEHCNYTTDDNGTITVSSNEKWTGAITVAGGSSEMVKGVSGTLTLPVSDWANNSVTFAIDEMGADDAVIISPYTTADKTNMELLELFPSAEGNQITLTATSTPIVDISINYFILRGTENE